MYQTQKDPQHPAAELEEGNVAVTQSQSHVVIPMPDSPSPSISKPKSNGFWRKTRVVFIVMVVVLVLLCCGAGAIWYFCVCGRKTKDSSLHATATHLIERKKSEQSRGDDKNRERQRAEEKRRRDVEEKERRLESDRAEFAREKSKQSREDERQKKRDEEQMRDHVMTELKLIKLWNRQVASEIEQLIQKDEVETAFKKAAEWRRVFEEEIAECL